LSAIVPVILIVPLIVAVHLHGTAHVGVIDTVWSEIV
jgi:hypothetical protein